MPISVIDQHSEMVFVSWEILDASSACYMYLRFVVHQHEVTPRLLPRGDYDYRSGLDGLSE